MGTLGNAPHTPVPGGGTLADFAAELDAMLKTWANAAPADEDLLNHAQDDIAAIAHVLNEYRQSPLDTEP